MPYPDPSGKAIPAPAHNLPTPTVLVMRPARNWWAVTPGFQDKARRDRLHPLVAEIRRLRAALAEVRR